MKSKKIVSLFILFLAIGYSNSVSSQNQLDYKVMMGYQGWFLAPGDGSTTNNPWSHWFRGGTGATPDAANLTVDMWPDMSEYIEKFSTNMTHVDGSNAQLFSSYSLSTTRKHFEWMRDYNVHGIYLQRFLSAVELQTSGMFIAKNKVLDNVIKSAAEYNRKYAVMYDVSGVTDATMYAKIVADWEYLVNTYDILNKPEYVKQNGKPVVAIWGIGFKDRGLTTATTQAIIDYFKSNAAPKYRAYVMGGVPEEWRTLSGSSETGTDWSAVYNSLDMISPWSVGRYSTNSGANSFKTNNIVPDLAACNTINKDYMPVIWPGFSWLNLKYETLNPIKRNGGQFYWLQAYNAVQAGVKFIYVAMFDEVDEGTAMFKITETKAKLPVEAQDRLVSLDIDGVNLPSDWYLKLADQTQKMLDGTIPLTNVMPITPSLVTAAGNGSEFIGQLNVPTAMGLSQKSTVNVTLKNIGSTTWTKASGYKLGSQSSQDNTVWGFSRVNLSDTDVILPGQEKTFLFEITAPSSAGYTNFQWKLIKEGLEWFGALTPNKIIAIGEGGNYLDDCDAKTNWNPSSLVLNNINQIQGLNALEFTGSATPEYSKAFPTPYNTFGSSTGAILQFWYYVSDVSMIQTNNYVEIGSSGVPDSNEYQWTLTGLVNGWNFIQLNTAYASITGGTPNLSAINWFRIYGVKTGSITTRIDAIQLLGNSILSTDNFNKENSLTIYPNPVDSEIYINFSLAEPSDVGISVINYTGQIVLQNSEKKKLDSGSHTIKVALNTLSKGVYLARININNRVFVRKVIIE
jgi:hypothetical protein